MKKLILVAMALFIVTYSKIAAGAEGTITSTTPDPVNIINEQTLGLTFDGIYYWVTSVKSSDPTQTKLYTLTTNFGLVDVNSNLGHYYVSLAYDKDSGSIIAAYSNKIVRLNGTTPSSISEDANDWFDPPTGKARAITYGGNGYLWVVGSDNNIYKVDLAASFGAQTAQTVGSSLWVTGSQITGLTYDGHFLWVFDSNSDLYKEDINNNISLDNYNFYGTITSYKGDITFNGDDVIIYGSDSTANFYTIDIAPNPVLNLQAADNGAGNTVTVSWTEPLDPTIVDYVIKWDTSQWGTYSASNIVGVGTTSVDISGLDNFQTYYFIVAGRDANGTSMPETQLYYYYYTTAMPTKPTVVFNVNKSTGPYSTISSAISAASKGDRVEINDSEIYNENIFVNKPYLTICAVDGATPTVTCDGSSVITIISNNVKIKDLTIQMGTTATAYPVIDIMAYKVVIDNCKITADNNTFNYTGIRINNSYSSNRIENCNIGENLYTSVSNAGYGTTIINNEIHNSTYGIIMSSEGNIYMNKIHDINNDGILIPMSIGTIKIFYNTIYNCGINGINNLYDNTLYIYNNTITKNNFGINLLISTGSYWYYIYNNIIYDNSNTDIYINDVGGHSYNIYNNCYASIYTNGGIYYFSQNIDANPLFTDAAAYDFSLTENSPCIDAGRTINYSTYNENFPAAYNTRDIGAYEYIPPTEPATAPSTKIENDISVNLSKNNLQPGDILTVQVGNFTQITSSKKLFVSAEIYSITGEKVRTLVNRAINSSEDLALVWDGKDSNNQYVKSGLYLLYIKANNTVKTEKFFWLR